MTNTRITFRGLDRNSPIVLETYSTDNITLSQAADHKYRGIMDERVKNGFESGLDIVVEVLVQL